MSTPIISVENLGKAYRLGLKDETPDSLVGMAASWIKAPLKNFKNLRRLDVSKADTDDEDVFWALKDVSFEVNQGDVVGIIGRNGAGKSTLLKVLSRITEPTAGRAVIRGRVSSLLEVGTGFHPELSGRDNIYMNGTILGMKKREIDKKFDEIVEFSGVEKFLDTPVKRYSSGMMVRLAFSVAAHLEPEILIVDEVLAVGDAEFQKKCMGKMQDVAKGGRTVIFVSHNMAAVKSLCKTGIILQNGSIIHAGVATETVDYYLSQLRSKSQTSLNHRTDRDGDGSARCLAVWFENESNQQITTACSGQQVQICLDYECHTAPQELEFRISIYDSNGQCLAHNSTEYVPVKRDQHRSKGIARCTIPKLALPPGNYYVNTSLYRANTGRADRVESAAELVVEAGDFYGTGKIPPSGSSSVLFQYTWDFRAPLTHETLEPNFKHA